MNDDIELIKKLKNKENEAWRELITRYYKGLVIVCGRYVRNWDEAKDLVHDSIIKAMQNINKFDSTRYTTVKPWLWQIAKNTALNHVKARKRREDKWQSIRPSNSATTQTYLKIMDSKPGPRTEAHQKDKSKLLFDCLDKLDEKFSEVVFLHYMDGLTRKQIAEVLNIPENTVKSRLRIGMERLRAFLRMTP